jgi:hypothetical protein
MAKVTNAFSTYNAVGNREDLSNAIYNIDPFDTPVMSAIRRRNVKNRLFDWQTEFLPTVNLTNAYEEGFLLVNKAAQPTIRQNNVVQISERDATVSGSQEESDAAGKGSEMAHQMAMASKVLKNDIESADAAHDRSHLPLARPRQGQEQHCGRRYSAWHCDVGITDGAWQRGG